MQIATLKVAYTATAFILPEMLPDLPGITSGPFKNICRIYLETHTRTHARTYQYANHSFNNRRQLPKVTQ
jgi:hypothetical protein